MKAEVNKYQYRNGADYCEITLINDRGLRVCLLNYGATLEKVLVPTDEGLENVIMSLDTPADYSKERNFLGGTVGRVVGRIRNGQWRHGAQILQLSLNDGRNHIHGGTGTDTQVFSFVTSYDSEMAQATFTLFDPDGANGYPGNLQLRVSYTLDNHNQLTYKIMAISDQLTIFNPTNHVYFRLDGPDSRVNDLMLQISSDYYLPLDDASLPYMGRRDVTGTVFDFRSSSRIGDVLASQDAEIKAENGLNHPFILRGNQPAVLLTSPRKKRSVQMQTKAPAVVVYTANHFNHTGVAAHLGKYDGVTLEAQFPPASGSDLSAITMMPNQQFETWTSWHFVY